MSSGDTQQLKGEQDGRLHQPDRKLNKQAEPAEDSCSLVQALFKMLIRPSNKREGLMGVQLK